MAYQGACAQAHYGVPLIDTRRRHRLTCLVSAGSSTKRPRYLLQKFEHALKKYWDGPKKVLDTVLKHGIKGGEPHGLSCRQRQEDESPIREVEAFSTSGSTLHTIEVE